jgi:hypothetical protein
MGEASTPDSKRTLTGGTGGLLSLEMKRVSC